MTQYIPLSRRDGDDERGYQVLHDGTPPWIAGRLVEWVELHVRIDRYQFDEEVLDEIELDLKMPNLRGPASRGFELLSLLRNDARTLLNVVNWLLEHRAGHGARGIVAEVLGRGGSVWTVVADEGDNNAHLERRVPQELMEMVSAVIARADVSANHLRSSWCAAWGIPGNPDEAYDQAVKAVEAAMRPIVSPANTRATLGTIIADIRNKPDKFAVRLSPQRGADAVSAFCAQLEVLWQSHRRHGDPGEVVSMSPDEARDAVTLAVQAVDWVQRGAFMPAGLD